MGLRSDSYPDPARIVTGTRHMDKDTLKDALAITDLVPALGDFMFGEHLTDPRVASSHGGGACPEQHYGWLQDGRCFYLRMRHSQATLCLGAQGLDPYRDLPQVDPRWDREAFDRAMTAKEDYPYSFFLGPRPSRQVYDYSKDLGYFLTDDDRNRVFTELLDEVLADDDAPPAGTGWCAPSP